MPEVNRSSATRSDGGLGYGVRVAAVAAAYFAAAKLGLSMAFVAEQVSAVWPPAGIALAAVLLLGPRMWPGILLGAFAANAMVAEPSLVALGIAVGNTLEALAGAWLLRRFVRPFGLGLGRLRGVVALVCLAAGLAPTIAATIGVTTLCLGGVQPWAQFSSLWPVWWLGDATGILVVTPLLLVWVAGRGAWTVRHAAELAVLIGGLVALCLAVFAGLLLPDLPDVPLGYAVFPFVLWAGLRFQQPGVTLVTLVTSTIAIASQLAGRGSFVATTPHQGLVLMQTFLAVVAITGLCLGAAVAERDRSERYRADLARESEATLQAEIAFRRAIESSMPAGVAAIDLEGRQFYVNRAFADLVGWPAEELVGATPPFVYWPEEELAAIQTAFEATIRERTTPGGFELRFQRRDGERFDALVHIAPLIDGDERRTGWLASVADISERKRTEAALRRSEERYRSLVSASAQVVWITNAEGQVVDDLPTWHDLTGQAPRETLGLGWAAHVHPDDAEQVLAIWQGSLASGNPHVQEFRLRARDGSYRDVRARAVPVREVDGRIREWVGTLSDITESKALDRELRERAEQLAEADRRKDEFLAMLGHELRNPLAPMINALEILRTRGMAGPHGERMRDLLERQVRHLARLVDDLLEVSRITRGEILLRRERIDLGGVVARAAETVRPILEERRHVLAVELAGEQFAAEADAVRLEQVVANLLNNAAKYTEPGGRIELRLERDGEQAVLSVADNGIGMGPDLLPHVFDLFTQGSRSLDRSQGGLGIGLTMVRRIVELHGGTVEAYSEGPGKGSRLVVRLPLLPPGGDFELTAAQTFEADDNRLHVLVVEDHRDAAETLVELLRLQGYAAQIAADGPSGIAAASELRPDVVLLDLGLPGIDGFEVARRLRAVPELAGLTLIALSGYGRAEDRRRSAEAGIDHHLVKPVDLQALQTLLAEVAAAKQA
jgi:PAS domain S-box-containing protein